jgi:hypothetical protein
VLAFECRIERLWLCEVSGSAVGDVDVVVHRGPDPGADQDHFAYEVLAELDGEFTATCTPIDRSSVARGAALVVDGVDGVVLDPLRAGVLRTVELRPVVHR